MKQPGRTDDPPPAAAASSLPLVRRWRLPIVGDAVHATEADCCRVTLNFGPQILFASHEGSAQHHVYFLRHGVLFLPPGVTPTLRLPTKRNFAPRGESNRLFAAMLPLLFDVKLFERACALVGEPADLPHRMRPMSLALDPFGQSLAKTLALAFKATPAPSRALLEQVAVPLAMWIVEHRTGVSHQDAPRSRAATGLDRALARIDSDLDQELPLQTLADEACMSRYHFARSFKAATGLSPHQYVIRARLERAKRMLSDCARGHRDIAIGEIALDAGFSSHSQFSSAFTRAMGCSPSAWLQGQQQALGKD